MSQEQLDALIEFAGSVQTSAKLQSWSKQRFEGERRSLKRLGLDNKQIDYVFEKMG